MIEIAQLQLTNAIELKSDNNVLHANEVSLAIQITRSLECVNLDPAKGVPTLKRQINNFRIVE